ncbi:LysE/ArgO family amino acid transporter [Faucicola boevrei]|uniref:LysE/ArgO family amino acid transporter n=1 Tax=Faucicola boevrei TaxID=346665 RepID=UPI000365980A|nr:LysE/ArgO family amino acid transporter [Moraxella boevrei]
MSLSIYLYGMSMGFSLILAIGAQNAFVLKQGLKREFVFTVCLICALSDALLISAGVFGFGKFISQYPQIVTVAKYAGALFLFAYGARNFASVLKSNDGLLAKGESVTSFGKVVALCVAFTWLNPHVYLDTVVFLGAISTQFNDKIAFALGAMSASFLFFFGLGFGARLLEPIFRKPKSWQILDVIIGIVMWAIALKLLIG